jgi:hypothetical protein
MEMPFSTVEQLIRIGMYAVGAYALGNGVADGELYQGAIGGVVAVGAFLWWMVRERNREE